MSSTVGASVVDPFEGETEPVEGGSVPAENPCVARLRHRRLLAFLQGQRYDGAFDALLHQTRDQFSLEHLQQLVTKGLWEDAAGYVESFLPTGPRSFDAQVLYNFLLMHHYIASFVAGDKAALGLILDNEWMHYVTYAQKADDPRLPPPVMARSVLFIQGVRACMDWEGVRTSAASDLHRLVWQTPELSGSLTLPANHMMPHDVLPIGLGLCRRRPVKKQVPRVKSVAVARVIKGSRRHIRRLKRSSFESFHEAKKWLSAVIDNSLQGGVPLGCYVLQPSGKEGSTILPVWNLPNHAGSSVMTAMTNAEKGQEGCYDETENARPGINPRKNLRANETIIEDSSCMKNQRTTGTFSDASMGAHNEVGVEGRSLSGPHRKILNA